MGKKEAEKTARLEAQEKIRLETERAKLEAQKVADEKARLEVLVQRIDQNWPRHCFHY